MSPARSTRRFVRRVSVTMLLTVLLVGVAGLGAMRLSTGRADTISDQVDPAITANAAALQVMTDAQSQIRGSLLPGAASPPSSLAATAGVGQSLGQVQAAASGDPALPPLVDAERLSAQTWLRAYSQVAAAVAAADQAGALRLLERADLAFVAFQSANGRVDDHLVDRRGELSDQAATLRDGAELALGLLVVVALITLSGVGALASRVLVAPLVELTGVVERLRRGERDARAPTGHGPVEVRQVASSVNALADEVEAWRDAQTETERLRRLSVEISRTVREELDLEAVLQAPALLGPALEADRCWLRLVEDGSLGPILRSWSSPELPPMPDLPPTGSDPFGLAEQLWHRAEAYVMPYVTGEDVLGQQGLDRFVAATGARSLLIVPVGAGDTLSGLLGWAMTDGPRGWTTEEVAWAQRVAADLGRGIEHASLYERQRELVGKLQDLDRRKDDFLSTVSHELRTPLTSITGYLELVREGAAGEVPAEMDRMLEVVDRNAARLRALIEDLLVLSRIEDGRLTGARIPVDLGQLLAGAVDTVRPEADRGGVRLRLDTGPAGLRVVGDPAHLDRVGLNLLSNAVKFTPAGGQVDVLLRHDEATGEAVLVCADSGIGIPLADQPGIFARFFRASNASPHAVPGTGLGLSVLKGIVDSHGGTVSLTSRERMGTTVTVRLPAVPAVPAGTVDAAVPADQPGMPAGSDAVPASSSEPGLLAH